MTRLALFVLGLSLISNSSVADDWIAIEPGIQSLHLNENHWDDSFQLDIRLTAPMVMGDSDRITANLSQTAHPDTEVSVDCVMESSDQLACFPPGEYEDWAGLPLTLAIETRLYAQNGSIWAGERIDFITVPGRISLSSTQYGDSGELLVRLNTSPAVSSRDLAEHLMLKGINGRQVRLQVPE
ncbi:MAG: hypothetical protein AAGJ52_04735, partial [Pseudomonadota bacterium]